jgi:integrase
MIIIGADYHPGFQQIAFVDTETGELQERRLQHREEAEKFYRDLAAQGASVRVGMEASGHARWFERLLAELHFELWIGDAAKIRTKRVRKQKTDRQDAQLILRLMLKDDFPQIWVASWENRDLRQLLWHRHRMVQARKDGRQHRESTGSPNKRKAEQVLALRKAQVLEDRWNLPRSRSPRLGTWMEEFLKSVPHEKTRSRYRSSVNNILAYFGDKIRLAEITPEAVFRFQQKRAEDGVGKATVNRDTSTLSSSLSRAKKMRLISRNPCCDVGKLNERRERRQAKPLSYEEEARVKQFAPPWLSTLITLLVETGLRVRKEALPLRWLDVSLDTEPGYIHVRDSKTTAGLRTVWLTNYCREVLIKWRLMLGPDFSPYVFPSPRIPGMHVVDYKTAWQKAGARADLKDRRIYDLRSTFASRANGCRASGLTVAHLLGHASTRKSFPPM